MVQEAIRASTDQLYDSITAAATDGRCHNVRFRQNQMHILHTYLRENCDKICLALREGTHCTELEALSEYTYTVYSIRRLYDGLNFDDALRDEYSITRNQDNINRRVPHGIVLVRPSTYCRLFSIISALAAALAAGNCVLVEVSLS